MTIFYRGTHRAARYGFRHIIRDFFRVPGEIGGICWRVFGGTSERILVDLDRAPRTRHNVWMTGESARLPASPARFLDRVFGRRDNAVNGVVYSRGHRS